MSATRIPLIQNIMKRFLSTLTLISLVLTGYSQTTYVPDDNFEQKLIELGYDDVLDNQVVTENINGLLTIDLAGSEISELTGIEDFEMLEGLYCSSNSLTEIDLSENLNLEVLVLGFNSLTSLDLSANTNLTVLSCDNNNLGELNLSGNLNLIDLFVPNNLPLTSLDLSGNPLVEEVTARDCGLTEINLSDCSNLRELNISSNALTTIDFSNCAALTDLNCSNNALVEVDLSFNLVLDIVAVKDCGLEELNLEGLNVLSTLDCSLNELDEIDLSDNVNLLAFNINSNNLVALDLSAVTSLQVLDCYGNDIVELGLTLLTELRSLNCGLNPLTELNVSANDLLEGLHIRLLPPGCVVNLDLSDKPNLQVLVCSQNEGLVSVNLKNGNPEGMNGFMGNSNPSLMCVEVDDLDYAEANWTISIDDHTEISEFCGLGIENNRISFTSVYPNPTTEILNVEINDEQMDFSLIDLSGKLIQTGSLAQGVNPINVSDLPAGVYFLKLNNAHYNTTHKTIIK